MKDVKSVLISGLGGMGAILVSKILTEGLVQAGYDVKQSESHGMAQRGGPVTTQVRYGEKVYGPVFGKGQADIMVALEQMEAVRSSELLNANGIAIINDYRQESATTASGLEEYPEGCIDAMKQNFRTVVIPAEQIAEELGNPRCMNVVMFGALSRYLDVPEVDWEKVVAENVPEKVRELNVQAYRAGREAAGNAE